MKEALRRIIEDTNTTTGRMFDWALVCLIIYSIVTLTIETLPNISAAARRFFRASEIVVTLLFSAEYIARLYVAHQKRDYALSAGGLIDLLAIAPFYLGIIFGAGGVDLRAIRAFRLFRILRLLKIRRYNKALGRLLIAFRMAREEIVLYMFLTLVLLYIAATGIYYFENAAQPESFKSIAHSLWWAVATLTTVGYGDVYPVTLGGRVFTFFVLMIGLGIVAIPSGLLASALTQVRDMEADTSESAALGDTDD